MGVGLECDYDRRSIAVVLAKGVADKRAALQRERETTAQLAKQSQEHPYIKGYENDVRLSEQTICRGQLDTRSSCSRAGSVGSTVCHSWMSLCVLRLQRERQPYPDFRHCGLKSCRGSLLGLAGKTNAHDGAQDSLKPRG